MRGKAQPSFFAAHFIHSYLTESRREYEELRRLLLQIDDLMESVLQRWELLDADALATLEVPIERFEMFVLHALSLSSSPLHIDLDRKLRDVNMRREKIHGKHTGFKRHARTDSVSNGLRDIKSSLERAIGDLTVRCICSSFKMTGS